MDTHQSVSQRDLRLRSKEIMDAVEQGASYTVTRDGRDIGELVPLRHRQRFITRRAFAQMSESAPPVDLARFRDDQQRGYDGDLADPYAR